MVFHKEQQGGYPMNLRMIVRLFVLLVLAGAVMVVILSSHGSAQAQESADAVKKYTSVSIQPGDTLWSIASIYADGHYSCIQDYIDEVKFINNLSGDLIYAHEYLLIPYYEG